MFQMSEKTVRKWKVDRWRWIPSCVTFDLELGRVTTTTSKGVLFLATNHGFSVDLPHCRREVFCCLILLKEVDSDVSRLVARHHLSIVMMEVLRNPSVGSDDRPSGTLFYRYKYRPSIYVLFCITSTKVHCVMILYSQTGPATRASYLKDVCCKQ
jgi:hypothetical protein